MAFMIVPLVAVDRIRTDLIFSTDSIFSFGGRVATVK